MDTLTEWRRELSLNVRISGASIIRDDLYRYFSFSEKECIH